MGQAGADLGLSGGAAGTGFVGPQSAPLLQPTTVDQATTAYNQSQAAIQQQQNFTNALVGQNGIQNQNQVYGQLQGIANGTGPNPAQAMLAQSTAANTSNQAALMAGNRGSNANAGLIARQAAQQGAQNQQAAAGQAATMQANQSLGAIGQMSGVAGSQIANAGSAIGATNQVNQGEQGQLLGSISNYNNAQAGMQANINNANAGLAQSTMKQGLPVVGAVLNALAEGGEVKSQPRKMYYSGTPNQPVSADYNNQDQVNYGSGATDMSQVGAPQPASPAQPGGPSAFAQRANAKNPSNPQPWQQAMNHFSTDDKDVAENLNSGFQNLSNKIQGAFASTPQQSDGTLSQSQMNDLDLGSNPNSAPAQQQTTTGPDSSAPGQDSGDFTDPDDASKPGLVKGIFDLAAKGGQAQRKVPALVSPGEKYLSPKAVKAVAKGADPMKAGETIPGTPRVGGAKNSYANDTVPKTLEEGGVVIPRSVTKSKQPSEAARRFVHAIAAKHGMRIK